MPNASRIFCYSTCATFALGALGASCGHSRGEAGRPEATLAASSDAQAAFRALRAAWFSGSTRERRKLEAELRTFLVRFPADEDSDMVRVLVAYDCVSRGSLLDARIMLATVREHVGSVSDFARVVEAYALLREGKADRAWSELQPLAGKIVDSDERMVFSELRLRVAVDAGRYERAVRAAEELLTEAPLEARTTLEETVRDLFQHAPKADLVQSLASFDQSEADESASSAARAWLRNMLRERLVALAVHEKDAPLARHLLDSAPAALRASDTGAELVGIAGGGRTSPLILGRSLGVVLSLGSAELRRRSASVTSGLARGLGLPDSLSKPGSVSLISHDDGGSGAGTVEALRELSAEGAAILVAGVDSESAETAAHFAEDNGIAVMLIQIPAAIPSPYRNEFALGESPSDEQAALDLELSRRKLQRVARVGRGGEACDAADANALGPRFSVDEWRRDRVSAVLVLGSAGCADEVMREMGKSPASPLLALGLEASEFLYSSDAPRGAFGLGAGSFPSAARPDAPENSALPALDWYEALGHDAALLARGALAGFPDGRVDDVQVVRDLHARAMRALGTAQAALWTSDARGFSDAHVLPRALKTVSADSQPKKLP